MWMAKSRLKVPAKLPERIHRCIQEMAKKAFIALDCAGMARRVYRHQHVSEVVGSERFALS